MPDTIGSLGMLSQAPHDKAGADIMKLKIFYFNFELT